MTDTMEETEAIKRRLFNPLLESGMFLSTTEEEQSTLFSDCAVLQLAPGDEVENLPSSMIIMDEGNIEIYLHNVQKDEKQLVRSAGRGEIIFSYFELIDIMIGGRRTEGMQISGKATKQTTVLSFPSSSILTLTRKNPAFTVRLMQVLLIHTMYLRDMTFSFSAGNELWSKKTVDPLPRDIVFSQVKEELERTGLYRQLSVQLRESLKFSPRIHGPLNKWVQGVKSKSKLPTIYKNLMSGSQTDGVEDVTNTTLKKEICESFMKQLELEDCYRAQLLESVKILKVKEETSIFQKYMKTMDLVYVYDGKVEVVQSAKTVREEKQAPVILGIYPVLTGEPQRDSAQTGPDGCTTIALFSQKSIFEMIEFRRELMIRLCYYHTSQISFEVRMLQLVINWEMYAAGNLIESRKVSPSIMYVVQGRLRREDKDSYDRPRKPLEQHQREFGRGKLIGLDDFLIEGETDKTYIALRDSVIARIPFHVHKAMMRRHLDAFLERLRENLNDDDEGVNVSSITIVPVSDDIPIRVFQRMVANALEDETGIHTRVRLKEDIHIPGTSDDSVDSGTLNYLQLQSYLAGDVDNAIDVYATSTSDDRWGKWIVNQADVVLVVAMFNAEDTKMSRLEQYLEETDRAAKTSEKLLLLLHVPVDGKYVKPSDTYRRWLQEREGWITTHLHIRCPVSMTKEDGNDKEHLRQFPDFSRLARYITKRSCGVVLGGGGARGAAHIGVIKSMLENGKPIDMVGGTSMGAMVGAMYCKSTDIDELNTEMKPYCRRMGGRRRLLDITLPYLAILTGKYVDNLVKGVIGENTTFADLWLPYFNISTDITDSEKRLATKGKLWLYVRASMSIAATVPPMIDPEDKHYLYDGGFVDNLPAQEMANMGAKKVYAVDVSGSYNLPFVDYGEHVSGFWLVLQKLNPFRKVTTEVPDLVTVFTRLTCITGDDEVKRVMRSKNFIYIRPDVTEFGTLEWDTYDDVFKRGYEKGQEMFGPPDSKPDEEEETKKRSHEAEEGEGIVPDPSNPLVA